MADHDPDTPMHRVATPKLEISSSSSNLDETWPETPNPSHVTEPPTQPPHPPKIRIRRRRAVYPPTTQAFDFGSSEDLPIPTIEVPSSISNPAPLPITPTSALRGDLLTPSPSSSHIRAASPPKTPVHQIFSSVEALEPTDKDWSTRTPQRGEEIERPLSALSVFSDSSASSHNSSDSAPSFGESCTSPESEAADPFVSKDGQSNKPHKLSAPFQAQSPLNHPHKRQKTHKVKWTNEMDEHLWMTYMAYLSDPTVTPFKTLPGSAPPLGVCHRVAREAKRSWKGPKTALPSIPESTNNQQFGSLDATLMRETSAPPNMTAEAGSTHQTTGLRPTQRSHSSNELSRKPLVTWPRSEASTRRRLRELCKFKPMLPPHYQRLMRTRSPSPFESSSSKQRTRSSRLSPPTSSMSQNQTSESLFSTRDMNLGLATSTSTTMQPGGPLSQLASDMQTPRRVSASSSTHSSIRGAHQKSQSLQLSLGLGTDWSNSMRRLASPFQEGTSGQDFGSTHEEDHKDTPTPMDRDTTPKPTAKLDSPVEIHAPRPMSGSMKRRAEYQLGEELITDDVNARRDFLEGLFRDSAADGHRRVRSRGFSMGAMRHATAAPPPTYHLSELFTRPPEADGAADLSSILGYSTQSESNGNAESGTFVAAGGNDNSNLAPPPTAGHARRLGSPFAPSAASNFRNTFPRSLFPQGLESISALEYLPEQRQPKTDEGESNNQDPFT